MADFCLRILALTLALSSSAYGWKPESGERPQPLDVVEYVDGSAVSLEALRGRPTVLYFGADWCVPCIERGRPAMIAAAKKYGPAGLQTVFVSMDDNKFRADKVRESRLIGIPIAMARIATCPPGKCPDGLRDLGNFGRIFVYPTAIVLDADGVVVAKMDRGIGVAGGLDGSVGEVMKRFAALPAAQLAPATTHAPGVGAAAHGFDGPWNVTMRCPPTDVAKGYSHRFGAEVKDSFLRADYGKPGEPGWQSIRGELAADGSATLLGEGIVGNSDYAARNSPAGKAFNYEIGTKFTAASGSGQRTAGRRCDFTFSR